jgi:formate/nitrite transporter FocA (FNT family)
MEEYEQNERMLHYGRAVQTEARLRKRRMLSLLLAAVAGAVLALALAFAILMRSDLADGSRIQEAARRVLPLGFSAA